MTVLITLTTAGNNTGPFNLYSNTDGYVTAFETGVSKSALVSGYTSSLVPEWTTEVLVQSTGACDRDLYLIVAGAPTTTSTTSSTTSTTSSSTTQAPTPCLTGDTNAIATCSNGETALFTIADGYQAIVHPQGYYYSGTGTRYYYAYITDSTDGSILYSLTYTQTGSAQGTWSTFNTNNTLPAGTYNLHLNTVSCQGDNGSGTFILTVGDCSVVDPTYYYYNIQRYDCTQDCAQGTIAIGRATNALDIGYFYHPPASTDVYEILSPTTGTYYNIDLYGSPSRETCSEACSA